METLMRKNLLLTGALTAMVMAGMVVSTTTPASAYVVCNRDGDCWHTDSRYSYPGIGFTYHPDDWYFHQTWGADRRYREYHNGRGYWRGGVWVTF